MYGWIHTQTQIYMNTRQFKLNNNIVEFCKYETIEYVYPSNDFA